MQPGESETKRTLSNSDDDQSVEDNLLGRGRVRDVLEEGTVCAVLLLLDCRREPVHLLGDRDASIAEDTHELAGKGRLMVLSSKEGDRLAELASTSSPTDPVDVVL